MQASISTLRNRATALRGMAAATADHRVWRSCRDLADQLDALAREAGAPGLTPRQIVARVLLDPASSYSGI